PILDRSGPLLALLTLRSRLRRIGLILLAVAAATSAPATAAPATTPSALLLVTRVFETCRRFTNWFGRFIDVDDIRARLLYRPGRFLHFRRRIRNCVRLARLTAFVAPNVLGLLINIALDFVARKLSALVAAAPVAAALRLVHLLRAPTIIGMRR